MAAFYINTQMRIIERWLVFSLAIYVSAKYLLPGVHVENFSTALVAAIGLGLINAIIKPIVQILTLPINILTLGLLSFVINALMVMLAAQIVPGFSVDSFWWALIFSLVVSLINGLIHAILGDKKHA